MISDREMVIGCGAALLAVALVAACPAAEMSDAVAVDAPAVPVSDMAFLRNAARGFVVVGANRLWNTSLMRWAELMADKVAAITGLEAPCRGRTLRIVIAPRRPDTVPDVTWAQVLRNGVLVQQLTIHDYEGVDIEMAEAGLCELLLNGYLVSRREPVESTTTAANDLKNPVSVPSWLALGIARNVYPELRSQNASAVLDALDRGDVPSVALFLAQADRGPSGYAGLDKHICGIFVAWLQDRTSRADLFDAIFLRCAARQPVTAEWLSANVPECASVRDLESRWNEWLLRQKRVVYRPGYVTPRLVARLESELVVGVGDYGVPEGAFEGNHLPLGDLVALRKEEWVRVFARDKALRLKIGFVGRGHEVDAVIDAYCAFLGALDRRRGERVLKKLLKEAQQHLERLRSAQ